MKTALKIFAALLVLTGIIWSLQGANILPGSFMTGQIQWLVAGIITASIGIGLFLFANRQSNTDSSE